MKLVKCSDCGTEISPRAKQCPSCGAPVKKRTSRIGLLLLAVVSVGVVGAFAGKSSTPTVAASPEQVKANAEQNQRQTAVIAATAALRRAMKDPESFDLKEVVVKADGSGCLTYRARNSFNAMLQQSAVFVPGKKAQLLVEGQDGNGFVREWNKRCTPAGGEEITSLAKQFLD